MRRRLIAILLILVILFAMGGCGGKNDVDISGTTANTIPTDSTLYPGIPMETEVYSTNKYATFEETLAAATDIIVATYTGEREKHGIYYECTFSLLRQMKGDKIAGDFHVRILNQRVSVVGTESPFQYSESANRYTKGKKYILILAKSRSVYLPYDVYIPLNNILISDDKTPTMYNRSAVEKHSETQAKIEDFYSATKYIEEFLLKGIDTSRIIGLDFIRSDNLSEVVTKTPIIAEVVPIAYEGGSEENNTQWYMCKVQNTLKGSIPNESIEIIFMAGTVEIGSKYIVMMKDPGNSTSYTLSSKISVHSSNSTTAEQIKTMINNASAAQ